MRILTITFFTVIAAASAGIWMTSRLENSTPAGESAAPGNAVRMQTEEVVAQDRLLVDSLWSAIETLKTRALALRQIREAELKAGAPLSVPEGQILHWAEVTLEGATLKSVRQSARNPDWHVGPEHTEVTAFENHYLNAALTRMSVEQIRANGAGLLRLKQDSAHAQEWLAFAFLAPPPATTVVLALVDPSEAFPIFHRWTARGEGGNLRGYLVGADGFVLAHSQKGRISSSFSEAPVFRDGVKALLDGKILTGAGEHRGIDGLKVTAAYARPGTLPIAAVVERVVSEGAPRLSEAPLAAIAHSPGVVASAFGALVAILGLAQLALSAGKSRRAVPAPPLEPILKAPDPSPPVAVTRPAQTAPQTRVNKVRKPLTEAEIQREKLLLAQFETVLARTPDPRVAGRRLAETAALLMESVALYFSYEPKLRASVFRTAALGRPAGAPQPSVPSLHGLSFAVGAEMLERIARFDAGGKIPSIADDAGLSLLVAKRLGAPSFDAWPLVHPDGLGQGAAGLLGVLIVLRNETSLPRDPAASRAAPAPTVRHDA